MSGRRLVSIFILLFILIELVDPTTPFIRVSAGPAVTKNYILKQQGLSPTSNAECTLENSESNRCGHNEEGLLQENNVHAAVCVPSYAFDTETLITQNHFIDTGLSEQFDPSTLLRPPINS